MNGSEEKVDLDTQVIDKKTEKYNRDAFYLQATLIVKSVPLQYLEKCSLILQKRHFHEVIEEREVAKLCGYPICNNKLKDKSKNGRYRISLAQKALYRSAEENQYCSKLCAEKSNRFLSLLSSKPSQLRPTIEDVFGTSEPTPMVNPKTGLQSSLEVETTNNNQMGNPNLYIKQKWATPKGSCQVVERNPMQQQVQPSQRTTMPAIYTNTRNEFHCTTNTTIPATEKIIPATKKNIPATKKNIPATEKNIPSTENIIPATEKNIPATENKNIHVPVPVPVPAEEGLIVENPNPSPTSNVFPSQEQATLIEGFIFPFHKHKKAKKMEKFLNNQIQMDNGMDSSSSESESEFSDDPSDEEDEEDIVEYSIQDLSKFACLWSRLSDWITFNTKQWTKQYFLNVHYQPSDTTISPNKNSSQYKLRFESLCSLLDRHMVSMAKTSTLAYTVLHQKWISSLASTFQLYHAIDGDASEWDIIAFLCLLVLHQVSLQDLDQSPKFQQTIATLNLKSDELRLLYELFFYQNEDEEVATQQQEELSNVTTTNEEKVYDLNNKQQSKRCRKCRRIHMKCVCGDQVVDQRINVDMETIIAESKMMSLEDDFN